MPYIPNEQREVINTAVDALTDVFVNSILDNEEANYEGMVNYALTRLMMNIYGDEYDTRYSNINNAVGVLECVKLEFYRIVAARYENQKRHENGAVFPRDASELLDTIIVNHQKSAWNEDMAEDVKEAMSTPTGGEGSGSGIEKPHP